MRGRLILGAVLGVFMAGAGPVFGWSLLEEVTIVDLNLTAEMAWENSDAPAYCASQPLNLDRLSCDVIETPEEEEFWIGVDAAGNRYGTINGTNTFGTVYEIHRRNQGTGNSEVILTISKRVEEVLGKPVKLFISKGWEVDLVNGYLLLGLYGDCHTDDCLAEGDTKEHVGVVRISGLPPLIDILTTYEPSGLLTFTTPYHPQGLPAGDRYDMYTGDVATLADLAMANPFACDVASGQLPGYRVRVLDTVPSPVAGHADYFLTAVTHGTERRAGRKSVPGGLAARDASLLPGCPSP